MTAKENVEILKNYCYKTGRICSQKNDTTRHRCVNSIYFDPKTAGQVESTIKELLQNSALGEDGITVEDLKQILNGNSLYHTRT